MGYAVSLFECSRGCAAPSLAGAGVGALVAAGGVAAIAVLVLRSMSEWADQAPVTRRRGRHRRRDPALAANKQGASKQGPNKQGTARR